MAEKERISVSMAEFRALPESSQPTELIYGELVVSPTPRYKHQRLVFLLAKQLDDLAPDGETVLSPMDVYLDEEQNSVQPDVFWVRPNSKDCKLGEDDYWHGTPDLIIEILSPSTAMRDRGVKYALYEEYGVREYWIVDPTNQTLEVFVLTEGTFQRQGVYGKGKRFKSPALSGEVDLKPLFG